eukprot:737498-Amorphochlora_amoeboformis.AAC.1
MYICAYPHQRKGSTLRNRNFNPPISSTQGTNPQISNHIRSTLVYETQHETQEGFKSQVGIDFSSSCIQSLQTTVKETKVKGLDFKKMDVRELGFEDGSFDVIVDK